ncbi:hypothetical protein AGABI2DRAFT_192019 [Agaricus bisporus var. bisporus H97]|uniref:hypothetical protein n=1 Tax=Agaricus bisporus var. bisporus (strain H97 / ATCC MYA-4626 / FGSC 10389) TaxID=936046 RepID=UPI00029F6D9B|nr:hypothetical protein AGABI2DRAFT_192019 [Agaricus bisporus var. bisporus H97]EKV48403.1 hypothetical protein AGABI2DRAFT_192019 [Agaricus bisporus var. bisporus H97]
MADDASNADDRVIVWFDIDNTLYSASSKISQAMGERIHNYFVSLGLSHEEASTLHHRYYSQYGLALRGLKRYHDVDVLDFDRKCDGSLPLEQMISYDPALRKLFEDIDRSKARVWALTNAYKPHAERVLNILKLNDLVDGLVFCDYTIPEFSCKPEAAYYKMAMKQANVTDPSKCYFVDDNRGNIDGALAQGWGKCVHFCEKGLESMEGGITKQIGDEPLDPTKANSNSIVEVSNLMQLREIWSEIFRH